MGKPEPIPTVYGGKVFPSRGAMAKHLAPILGKSPTTLAHGLLDAGDDAEAVVRRYRPEEPAAARKTPSHDEVAMRFRSGSTRDHARPLLLTMRSKAGGCELEALRRRRPNST
jgi:hypothetical protein